MQKQHPQKIDVGLTFSRIRANNLWHGLMRYLVFFIVGMVTLILCIHLVVRSTVLGNLLEKFHVFPLNQKQEETTNHETRIILTNIQSSLRTDHPSDIPPAVRMTLSMELKTIKEQELFFLMKPKIQKQVEAYLREVNHDDFNQDKKLAHLEGELIACIEAVTRPLKLKSLSIKSPLVYHVKN